MKWLRSIVFGFGAMLMVSPADASSISVESMARMPVLEGGRIMPFDSHARLKLLQFSGKSSFQEEAALDWMARLLFRPDTVQGDQVFLINHPEVPEALGIDPGERRRCGRAHILGEDAAGAEPAARGRVDRVYLSD
jgi:hypothetical protein